MSLTEQVFLYCERQGPAILAEPLNALSNLAFFYAGWRLWRAVDARNAFLAPRLRLLAVLILLVGAGSLAFHTLATGWARILDIAFIGVFNLAFLVVFLEAIAGWPALRAYGAAAAFLAVDRASAAVVPATLLNGSVLYLPALATLVVLTAWARRLAPETGRLMTGATALFLVSLTARTVDLAWCGAWPWGTHWFWHMANAWVLYRLGLALQYGAQGRPSMSQE